MPKRTRIELKNIFKTGAKPTGLDFADLIDSVINLTDDGIEKQPERHQPLKITSNGDHQNLLDFHDKSGLHTWRLNQYPDDINAGVQRAGFNIASANGDTRLFIKQDDGNVGIANADPQAKLHVIMEDAQGDALRVDDVGVINGEHDPTPFVIKGDGRVGIGIEQPDSDSKLHVIGVVKIVEGHLQVNDTESVNNFSNDGTLAGNSDSTLPTEQAVRTYVNTILPKGVIVMWSGAKKEIPDGWALCDGDNDTPDLRGKFIPCAAKDSDEDTPSPPLESSVSAYDVKEKGGEDTVTLTLEQMPNHTHSVFFESNDGSHTHSDGAHSHTFYQDRYNENNYGNVVGLTERGSKDQIEKYVIADETGDSQYDDDGSHSHSGGSHSHSVNETSQGSGQAHENRPSFFALCYIMKII